MPNLVGIGLSQVPTNSMLGGLAYQDPEHASIKDLDLKNLSQINSEIADTASDVFVYDTRKDSDGGAWRKRTQHTSWYNETLGTATRGSRREFPAVAVIVAENDKVTIYDGDDPDLPMWMVFEGTDTGWKFIQYGDSNCTSLYALNGIICVGSSDGGSAYGNLAILDFIKETARQHNNPGVYQYNVSFTSRNVLQPSWSAVSGATKIVNTYVNDVAMTVLPNAPVDIATGLPIPTIAVGTASGISIIKDDGTVIDYINTTATHDVTGSIDFNDSNEVLYTFDSSISARRAYITPILNSDTTTLSGTSHPIASTGTIGYGAIIDSGNYNGFLIGRSINHITKTGGRTFATGDEGGTGQNGLSLIDPQTSTVAGSKESLISHISSDYNTGWMHGDIKGAFLSDTDITDIELITNGTFDSNTTGWTAYHSVASVDSNRLKIDDTANAGGWSSVIQEVATVIGKTYQFRFTYTHSSDSFLAGHYAGSYASAGAGTQPTSYTDYGTTSGTYTRIITATTTTTSLVLSVNNAGVSFVDNVSFKLTEQDRSVNNNGLRIYGTITKSAVATGAELVAYSGFSNSNYLMQPYNSDMQTGTGDFSVTCWFKTTSTSAHYEGLIYYNSPGVIDKGFQLMMSPSSSNKGLYWYVYGASSAVDSGYITGFNDGQWHCVVGTHTSSQIEIYVDGILRSTVSHTIGSINNSDAQFTVGRWYGNANVSSYWWRGDIALVRISGSAPSAEQVSKMYHDEKVLFQENAKATLYGSSDAVTALAFDDTTNLLYVGTSAGRSEFQGLRRINNTTDAVTTAISASNGLVAEQ